MKNATYKVIVQSTDTALHHTGIQYTVTVLENQAIYLSCVVPQGKFNVLFIYFFKLLVTFFFPVNMIS